MNEEIARRQSAKDAVVDLFKAKPLMWIPWRELAKVGGACAWRTRISDARRVLKSEGGEIDWNRKPMQSAYMYRPYVKLARSAETRMESPQRQLF